MNNQIIDESGDKIFFTIVPNYVLNHSTAIDQSLYSQMKKAAGENGECFITEENLCKKMGIGKLRLRKSIDYLIKHRWIDFLGRKYGKTRPVNTYKINDIWKLNADFYEDKKISSESAVSLKNIKDTVQISSKISSETIHKEEHIQEDISIINNTSRKQVSCPLGFNGEHKTLCIAFINKAAKEKGIPTFPNYPKQINALHKSLRAGFTLEDIEDMAAKLSESSFWQDRGWDLMTISNQLGKQNVIH